MPNPIYSTFYTGIVDEISQQLRQFQETDGPLADFAKQVEHFATSRIFIPEDTHDSKQKFSRRVPDALFGHRRALYPGVIMEVCYSQKSKRISTWPKNIF